MTDIFVNEVYDAWPKTVDDAWQVLVPVRELWRDEDRTVDVDDDEYRDGVTS